MDDLKVAVQELTKQWPMLIFNLHGSIGREMETFQQGYWDFCMQFDQRIADTQEAMW